MAIFNIKLIQFIVKRLSSAQSAINFKKLHSDFNKHIGYRDMISKNNGRYIKSQYFLKNNAIPNNDDTNTFCLVNEIMRRREQRLGKI